MREENMNNTYNGKMINVEGYIERKKKQNGVKCQEDWILPSFADFFTGITKIIFFL